MTRIILTYLAFLWPVQLAGQETVTVFAAASLRGALESAAEGFSYTLKASYGGSGAMARQVALGAPADLVILAHPDWDDWLEGEVKSLASNSALVRNRLVLIGPKGSEVFERRPDAQGLTRVLGSNRLAMGQRDAVPAGQYGQAWLENIGAWTAVEPKLAEAESVRAALTYVARSEAPLGIVYSSDANAEDAVDVLWRIDGNTHPPIRYPARALTPAGLKLLDHLESIEAQARFALFGFRPGEVSE